MKHHAGKFAGNPSIINKVVVGPSCLFRVKLCRIELNIQDIELIYITSYI